MVNWVNNNGKRVQNLAMSTSIQVKESSQKEVKELFEAVHNKQIPLSSNLIPVSPLPVFTSEDKNS